jgi:hypothetical protein
MLDENLFFFLSLHFLHQLVVIISMRKVLLVRYGKYLCWDAFVSYERVEIKDCDGESIF